MKKTFIILTLTVFLPLCLPFKHKVDHGPSLELQNQKACAEFSKNARFNPASVINEKWFIFYYWSENCEGGVYIFNIPTKNETRYIRSLLDGVTVRPINWTSNLVLMRKEGTINTMLLVERNDRGMYWQYPLLQDVPAQLKIRPLDVRLKQKGGYIGVLYCRKKTVYVMSKLHEIPPKNMLQEAAATMGYRGLRGRSYLYQGHHWLPIDDEDDAPVMNSIERYKRGQIEKNEIANPRPRLGPIYNY